MIDPVISVSLRCVLAVTFAAAAWHKVSDLDRFRAVLRSYRLFPRGFSDRVATSVPAAEIALAFGFTLPGYRWAAWGACALVAGYTIAIALNLLRGRRDIDCGCFGPAAFVPLSPMLLARNAIVMAGAAVASVPPRTRSWVWIDGYTVIAVVAVTILLWTSFWRLQAVSARERRS